MFSIILRVALRLAQFGAHVVVIITHAYDTRPGENDDLGCIQ